MAVSYYLKAALPLVEMRLAALDRSVIQAQAQSPMYWFIQKRQMVRIQIIEYVNLADRVF